MSNPPQRIFTYRVCPVISPVSFLISVLFILNSPFGLMIEGLYSYAFFLPSPQTIFGRTIFLRFYLRSPSIFNDLQCHSGFWHVFFYRSPVSSSTADMPPSLLHFSQLNAVEVSLCIWLSLIYHYFEIWATRKKTHI